MNTCPNCRHECPQGFKFCSECGTALAARPQPGEDSVNVVRMGNLPVSAPDYAAVGEGLEDGDFRDAKDYRCSKIDVEIARIDVEEKARADTEAALPGKMINRFLSGAAT